MVNIDRIQNIHDKYGDRLAQKILHPEEMKLLVENVRIVEKAIWGMLPKNRLGRAIIKHLKVYNGEEHPHSSQQPKILEF